MNKFFLGGMDREMVQIQKHLETNGTPFVNKNLGWNTAKASAYAEEIQQSVRDGFVPVLIELIVDCELPEGSIVIDHHGKRSAEPASLLQVLSQLGLEPSREDLLVAANDTSGPTGLRRLGFSEDEVKSVRGDGSSVPAEILQEAIRAIEEAGAYASATRGDLVVVRPSHSKCGPIADRLAFHWPDGPTGSVEEKLLVLSGDGEVNFFGNGVLCAELNEKFSGWSGGAGLRNPKGFGFWGKSGCSNEHVAIENFIRDFYSR